MTVRVLPFARFSRRLRVDLDEQAKVMAQRLGVTPAFLSSVESGRRNVPTEWIARFTREYQLSKPQVAELSRAVFLSQALISGKLDISHLADADKELVARLVRYFSASTRETLLELFPEHDYE